MKELTYLYENSIKACDIAGQTEEISDEAKTQQLSYITSEVQELKEALEAGDLVEQLDACQDILVTVFGFMAKLEQQGAWLEKAMVKTADNNLNKFPLTLVEALDTQAFYAEVKNKETSVVFNQEYKRYVIRDKNGKYLKCKGFVENDLSDCFDESVVKPHELTYNY